MGLTKQYLKYSPAGNLNIIANPKCNITFVTLQNQEGRFVAAGACEHVYIWDLRLNEKTQVLSGEKAEVTKLAASPNKRFIAVGYSDGTIKTFDLRSGENISVFVGHRSEITTLAFDTLGHRLASGSKDTDIIIWDVVAECGICRLVGHKGIITQVAFLKNHNIVVSSSKDTFVKFWHLDTEHNFKTLVGHRSEVWGFSLTKDDKYLITGCSNYELRVWKITFNDTSTLNITDGISALNVDEEDDSSMKYPLRCDKVGMIMRESKGRVVSILSDITGQVIGCHGVDNVIELFYILPDDQVKERTASRLTKAMKKARKKGVVEEQHSTSDTILRDELRRLPVIKISTKVKSLDLIMGKNEELRVCAIGNNNSIELYSMTLSEKEPEVKVIRSLSLHGHRTDVRAISFSSDNLAFATVSGDSIKLWNRPTLACLRTVECKYALSVVFVPGDRHLIVGLKNGTMLIVDIAVGDILEEVPAHGNELWSLCVYPDLKGVASGGGDQTVKFWQFELIDDPDSKSKAKVLSVLHTKTLKLEDGVLCIKISPNSRFIAVSLLDSTVKIFFLETFKFFMSLYGHKLPVLCLDISSDSTLIVTGSADRNIKIWGMDFGDCHRSLFAHDDSITGISFVPNTHYFFSCGKDGKVKQWDADIFQKIITLQGHAGESWNCAVSPNGIFVASCGSDKVVRLFERTSEILVLEDEAEEEREREENELATGETTAVEGQKQQVLPSRKTVNSERGAESILECLEVSKKYLEQIASTSSQKSLSIPLLMQAYKCNTVEEFFLETIKRIRASDLEEALYLLPYSAVCEILHMLPKILKNSYQAELVAKLTLSLVQAHHSQVVANTELLTSIENIKELVIKQISTLRDITGFNVYSMAYVQREIEEKEGIRLFKDATINKKHKNRVKKNKEKALKRAIMTL